MKLTSADTFTTPSDKNDKLSRLLRKGGAWNPHEIREIVRVEDAKFRGWVANPDDPAPGGNAGGTP